MSSNLCSRALRCRTSHALIKSSPSIIFEYSTTTEKNSKKQISAESLHSTGKETIAALQHAEKRSIQEVTKTIADFVSAAQDVRKLAEHIPCQFHLQSHLPVYKLGATAETAREVITDSQKIIAQTTEIRAHLQNIQKLPFPDVLRHESGYESDLGLARKEKKEQEIISFMRDEDKQQEELAQGLARLRRLCKFESIPVTSDSSSDELSD